MEQNKKTEFMLDVENSFKQVAEQHKNGGGKSLILIACEQVEEGEQKGKHTTLAMFGCHGVLEESIISAINDEQGGEVFKDAIKRDALMHLLKRALQ